MICQRRAQFVEFEVCGYVVCSVEILSARALSLDLTYFYASYVSWLRSVRNGASAFRGYPRSKTYIRWVRVRDPFVVRL
jgi:hypothetical protein